MKAIAVFLICFISLFVHGQTLLPLASKVVYDVQIRDTTKSGSDYENDWSWQNIEPSYRHTFLQRLEDSLLQGNLVCYNDAECTSQYGRNELQQQFSYMDTIGSWISEDKRADTILRAVYSLLYDVSNIVFNEQWRYDSVNMKISKDVFSWGVVFQHRDFVGEKNELVITDTAIIWIKNNSSEVNDWLDLAPEYRYKHNLSAGCPESFPHLIPAVYPDLKYIRNYIFNMEDAMNKFGETAWGDKFWHDSNDLLICDESYTSGDFPVYKPGLAGDIDTFNICGPLAINFTEQWYFSPSTLAVKKEVTSIAIAPWVYYEPEKKVMGCPFITAFFE